MGQRRKLLKRQNTADKWEEYFDGAYKAFSRLDSEKFEMFLKKALREIESQTLDLASKSEEERKQHEFRLVTSLSALGTTYLTRKNFEEAKSYIERGIEIVLRSRNFDIEIINGMLEELSQAYWALHLHELDMRLHERVLVYIEMRCGRGSPDVRFALLGLATAYASVAKMDLAQELLAKIAEITETFSGRESDDCKQALDRLQNFETDKKHFVCSCQPDADEVNMRLRCWF